MRSFRSNLLFFLIHSVVRSSPRPLSDALLRLLKFAVVPRNLVHIVILLPGALGPGDRGRGTLLRRVLVVLIIILFINIVLDFGISIDDDKAVETECRREELCRAGERRRDDRR